MACGVLGAVAMATPASSQLASRGGGGRDGGHDNGQHHNTYSHSCTSNDHAVAGNVCVIVDDLPILGHVLTGG